MWQLSVRPSRRRLDDAGAIAESGRRQRDDGAGRRAVGPDERSSDARERFFARELERLGHQAAERFLAADDVVDVGLAGFAAEQIGAGADWRRRWPAPANRRCSRANSRRALRRSRSRGETLRTPGAAGRRPAPIRTASSCSCAGSAARRRRSPAAGRPRRRATDRRGGWESRWPSRLESPTRSVEGIRAGDSIRMGNCSETGIVFAAASAATACHGDGKAAKL